MSLTPREAFKVGFLARCVEDGLSPSQIGERVKQASEKLAFLSELAGKAMDVGAGAVGGLYNYGLPMALAAPPILGGMAGYGLARATDIDDTDVADIKDQEVLDEYRRQTQRLGREREVKDYQRQKKKTGRIFL